MLAEQLGANDVIDTSSHFGPQPATVAGQPSVQEDAGHSSALTADTAHELANLVMVVSGSLEQLRRQPLDGQGRQQLMRAEWGIRQAAQLTRRVLSQAQGGDGRAEAMDLNAAVGGFAAAMGQLVAGRVQLAAELAPGRLPARFDAGLLELVLLNLVRSAAQAMPDGGTVVLRTLGPRLDGLGDQLTTEVSVSDNGAGVLPPAAFKPQGDGAGLGLWMTHRFASAYGGKVKVEAIPGQGTTVRISLPASSGAEQG